MDLLDQYPQGSIWAKMETPIGTEISGPDVIYLLIRSLKNCSVFSNCTWKQNANTLQIVHFQETSGK